MNAKGPGDERDAGEVKREQKKRMESLLRNRERLGALIETVPDGIVTLNLKGVITYCNTSTITLTGFSREDIVGRHFSQMGFLQGRDLPTYLSVFSSILKGEVPNPFEVTWRHRDGTPHLAEIHIRPLKKNNRVRELLVVTRDITEQKWTEAILRENEKKYRRLFEGSRDAIVINTRDGSFLDFNQSALDLFGYTKDEMAQVKAQDIYADPKDRGTFQREVEQNEWVRDFEVRLKKKGGKEMECLVTSTVWRADDGSVLGYCGVIRDITERKLAEEQIKASLKEKEILLREVHHRIKNNLQIVSSLLSLQSMYVRDHHYRKMFEESQSRIKSIALIHEKLYRSESLASINVEEYVRTLVEDLVMSLGVGTNVDVSVEVEDMLLGVDTAIPCGLIINELLSNCMKHAFPNGRKGEVKVALRSLGERVELSVRDNGVGIPEGLDIRNTGSLGLRLVSILAEDQLHGNLIVERDEGTAFCLTFRRK